MSGERVIFGQDGVIIHAQGGKSMNETSDTMLFGKLRLVMKPHPHHGFYVDWSTISSPDIHDKATEAGDETAMKRQESVVTRLMRKHAINFEVSELKAIEKSPSTLGWPNIKMHLCDGTAFPPLHFHNGGLDEFLDQLKIYVDLKPSQKDGLLLIVREPNNAQLQQSLKALNVSAPPPKKDPKLAVLSSFSQVFNSVKDAVLNTNDHISSEEVNNWSSFLNEINNDFPPIFSQPQDGFEVVDEVHFAARPCLTRTSEPITRTVWEGFFDDEGRVPNETKVLERIYHCGFDSLEGNLSDEVNSLRAEAWPFLLGALPYNATFAERAKIVEERAIEYENLKAQWKLQTQEQIQNWQQMRDNLVLIEKDVNRTDREISELKDAEGPLLCRINEILTTYVMYNHDLGYNQGMNDLLAPICLIMKDKSESETFWTFVAAMKRYHANFDRTQTGIHLQLKNINELLEVVLPDFTQYLKSHNAGDLFFCFRWLLVNFKRELSYRDTCFLWEVLWTQQPCDNLLLLCCIAIIENQKNIIMASNFGLDEILKHINDLAGNLDVKKILCDAEAIFIQLKDSKGLRDSTRSILGLPALNNGASASAVIQQPRPSHSLMV